MIPNSDVLTNKLGLLRSLQAFDRVCIAALGIKPPIKSADFLPQTYRLEEPNELQAFTHQFKGIL